jgi:hypothetical protein
VASISIKVMNLIGLRTSPWATPHCSVHFEVAPSFVMMLLCEFVFSQSRRIVITTPTSNESVPTVGEPVETDGNTVPIGFHMVSHDNAAETRKCRSDWVPRVQEAAAAVSDPMESFTAGLLPSMPRCRAAEMTAQHLA